MNIESFGLTELIGDMTTAVSTVGQKAELARDHTKAAIRQTARDRVAVDEGILRDSIEITEDGVEATARHAPFVERGTYKDPPQPFMDPAVDEHENRFALGVLAAGEF